MTPLADYWLKANLFLLLFYGCYWLWLRRHTFLILNRAYLLGTLLVSLGLPLLRVPGLNLNGLFRAVRPADEPVLAEVTIDADYGYATSAVDVPVGPPLLPDWPELLGWLVAAGAGLLLLRLGWRTLRLLRQIRQWPAKRRPAYTTVYPPTLRTPTFSFFHYLVLNPADVCSATVWQHELGHIRQWHSVDVLLTEVVQAFFWPNPALWGYRRALRETHEFLADRYATHDTPTQRDTYARFLVQYAFDLPADALTHPFSTNQVRFPTLKQRIQMLYEQHTRPRALWKYALVLPLALGTLAMTSPPEPNTDPTSNKRMRPVTAATVHVEGVISGDHNKPLPGATVSDKNSEFGATTDWKGHFQLNAPASATLVIRASGYHDMDLAIGPDIKETLIVDYRLIPLLADAPKTSGTSASSAASVRVSGVVRAADDKPLPGATIDIKNVQRGTTTDANGRFRIDAPGGSTLVTAFAGFKTQETSIPTNHSVMNVNMVLVPNTATTRKTRPATAPYAIAPSSQDKVFTVVEQQPRFPGGIKKLFEFLGRTLRYPQEAVQKHVTGKVFVAFVVNADGRIDRIQVLKGIGAGCDEEAVRVVSLMPKWLPGKQNGRDVATKYNLPINFQLKGSKKVAVVSPPSKPGFSYTADSVAMNKTSVTIHAPRSFKTNGMSKVLWFIDGKTASQESFESLPRNDIQSIDVLKGESALAQYGEEGRYGVIRITTKK